MEVAQLKISKDDAAVVLRKYKEHKVHQTPVDWEIQRLARLIAMGEVVIRGKESILRAGVNDEGLPKLAMARADNSHAHLRCWANGSGYMADVENPTGVTSKLRYIELPAGFMRLGNWATHKAIVPHIPPEHRPARGLANYTIFWEAEWQKSYPVDPILARRVGRTDFFVVLAQWDLTSIEREVLMSRMGR